MLAGFAFRGGKLDKVRIGKASRAFSFIARKKKGTKLPGREIDKDEWASWCSRDETINLAKPVRSVLPSEINRFL